MSPRLLPILIIALLVALGLPRWLILDTAPVHADEATGAKIVGNSLESGTVNFDPTHFHGPLLHRLGALAARSYGATDWKSLTITPLRAVTVVSGLLLAIAPLMLMRHLGKKGPLLSCAFLLTSPFLFFYSRIFIHETLLACCLGYALVFLTLWWHSPTWPAALLSGLFLGLAAATKETFILTPTFWACVAIFLRLKPTADQRQCLLHATAATLTALLTIALFYGGLDGSPSGVFDFFRTYWTYELTPGHEKPAYYYFSTLLLPHGYGRLWYWFGASIIIAALGFFIPNLYTKTIRFLTLSGTMLAIAYSILSYKVPWLMLIPVAHFAAATGFTLAGFITSSKSWLKILALTLSLLLPTLDAFQSYRVAFKFPSDSRNPLCYVPTSKGITAWVNRYSDWLRASGTHNESIAVIGTSYWPLPWYLRQFSSVGYWKTLPENAGSLPMIIALPVTAEDTASSLENTHVALPEGLRTDTPVIVFIRNDVWSQNTGLAPQ